jgi:UDP-N-acetyl-D-glucosamine dehydrogenase
MRHYSYENKKSVDITAPNLARYDAVLISTDHSSYDWNFIVKHARVVVDTRNATAKVKENRGKIYKA